ncbi:hypothetical protein [Rothia dentocariosa]|uniref:hypothetical protein n=1 Tax=Rothia dentocariosa TaxID=2047 RepID=UPI0028E42EB7|nr:hypothetical protein [Rothia dentocariosa]
MSRNRLSLTLNLDSSPLNTNKLNPGEVCFRVGRVDHPAGVVLFNDPFFDDDFA